MRASDRAVSPMLTRGPYHLLARISFKGAFAKAFNSLGQVHHLPASLFCAYALAVAGCKGENQRMNREIKLRLRNSLKHAKARAADLDAISGFLYLIRCNEFIKIGVAENVERRFNSLQTANPYEIELLKWWHSDTVIRDEKLLHAMFSRFRVRNEWFKLPNDILNALLSMTESDMRALPQPVARIDEGLGCKDASPLS